MTTMSRNTLITLHDLHRLLSVGEFLRVGDHDRAGVGRDPIEHGRRQPELRAEFGDQRPELERDHAVGGAHPVTSVVLEDAHERLVCDPVRLRPRRLHLRRGEQPVDAVDGRLAQRLGDRAGEDLQRVG